MECSSHQVTPRNNDLERNVSTEAEEVQEAMGPVALVLKEGWVELGGVVTFTLVTRGTRRTLAGWLGQKISLAVWKSMGKASSSTMAGIKKVAPIEL